MLSPGIDQQLKRVKVDQDNTVLQCFISRYLVWIVNCTFWGEAGEKFKKKLIKYAFYIDYFYRRLMMLIHYCLWLVTDPRLLWRRCRLVCTWHTCQCQLWNVCGLQGCVPPLLRHEHVVPGFLHSDDQHKKQQRPTCSHPQRVKHYSVTSNTHTHTLFPTHCRGGWVCVTLAYIYHVLNPYLPLRHVHNIASQGRSLLVFILYCFVFL